MGWHQIAFPITWDGESEPNHSIETLIACEVLSPIINDANEHSFSAWRFHRRCKNDEHGQVFRFSIYTLGDSLDAATEVFKIIESDSVVVGLRALEIIRRLQFEYDKTEIADERWSNEIQKAWHPFLSGVCDAWLSLAHDLSEKYANRVTDGELLLTQSLLSVYAEVESELNRIWEKDLCHAMLHHLSGIFGFQEMKVKSSIMMTF